MRGPELVALLMLLAGVSEKVPSGVVAGLLLLYFGCVSFVIKLRLPLEQCSLL